MLHPYGKSQEGSAAFGCLSCFDGKAEAWSNQVLADGDLHFEETYVRPTECCDWVLKILECVAGIVEFYKEKQRRRTGSEDNYAESIKISTAEG